MRLLVHGACINHVRAGWCAARKPAGKNARGGEQAKHTRDGRQNRRRDEREAVQLRRGNVQRGRQAERLPVDARAQAGQAGLVQRHAGRVGAVAAVLRRTPSLSYNQRAMHNRVLHLVMHLVLT